MKRLGKIGLAIVGFGGYQDAMLGCSFTLTGEGWGVGDFWGAWGSATVPNEADRTESLGLMMRQLGDLLRAAKVKHFDELVGVPIEAEFDGNTLKSWRVLTEVL